MGWHGPRGSCGCCGCPDETCRDADGNFFSEQINEVTFVFTNFPTDLVYYRTEETSGGSVIHRYRITIFNFSSLEGTYVREKNASCNWAGPQPEASLSYTVEEQGGNPGDTCDEIESGTVNIGITLGPTATEDNWFAAKLEDSAIEAPSSSIRRTGARFVFGRTPHEKRCDYQDLDLEVSEQSGFQVCPVSSATYTGSTATVT